jgi:tetratricopeptide (TPR) repeat protein
MRLEKELKAKGENRLYSRDRIAKRLMDLGDLAAKYDDPTTRKKSFAIAGRQIEPYVYNVKESLYPPGFLLWTFYNDLQWFESLKQYYMWLYLDIRGTNHSFKSYLLERLGLVSDLQRQNARAKIYYSEAAKECMMMARSLQDSPYHLDVYEISHAASLYQRSGKLTEAQDCCKRAIARLTYFYDNHQQQGWGLSGEFLRRVYQISNDDELAEALAKSMIQKCREAIEDEKDVDAKTILYDRINSYIGLGFCEEFLGNYDSAIDWFQRVVEAYHQLLESRKDIWDRVEQLSDWKDGMRYCRNIRKKIQLKRDIDNIVNSDEYLVSFFDLARVEFGIHYGRFHRIIEEELYEYCRLLTKADPEVFKDETEKLYWKTDEEGFIRKLEENWDEEVRHRKLKKVCKDYQLSRDVEEWIKNNN